MHCSRSQRKTYSRQKGSPSRIGSKHRVRFNLEAQCDAASIEQLVLLCSIVLESLSGPVVRPKRSVCSTKNALARDCTGLRSSAKSKSMATRNKRGNVPSIRRTDDQPSQILVETCVRRHHSDDARNCVDDSPLCRGPQLQTPVRKYSSSRCASGWSPLSAFMRSTTDLVFRVAAEFALPGPGSGRAHRHELIWQWCKALYLRVRIWHFDHQVRKRLATVDSHKTNTSRDTLRNMCHERCYERVSV